MLRLVAKNAVWNLSGFVVPAAVAFGSVPILLHLVGTERLGLLSLVWAVIGMFSVLDLGLGRALTRWIAELIGFGREAELPSVVSSTMAAALIVSLGLAILVLCIVSIGGNDLIVTSREIAAEALLAANLLAVGVAFTVYGSVLRGALEGFSDFRTVNLIKIPTGVAIFALPCVTALFTPSLPVAVCAMIAARAAGNWVMAHQLSGRVEYSLRNVQPARLNQLARYGGWITVSNVVAPMIVYIDRFIIGAVLTASAVSYYAVPADALSRIPVVPVSLATALFPTIASNALTAESLSYVVNRSMYFVAAVMIPLAAIALIFAEPILTFWVGEDFAARSTLVFQILAVGFCINGAGQVPFLALQAIGASRLVALWHTIQFLPYAVGLVLATITYGIVGVAVVWTLRVVVDSTFLYIALVHQVGTHGKKLS